MQIYRIECLLLFGLVVSFGYLQCHVDSLGRHRVPTRHILTEGAAFGWPLPILYYAQLVIPDATTELEWIQTTWIWEGRQLLSVSYSSIAVNVVVFLAVFGFCAYRFVNRPIMKCRWSLSSLFKSFIILGLLCLIVNVRRWDVVLEVTAQWIIAITVWNALFCNIVKEEPTA